MDAVVQWVRTSWTKRSRGAAAAGRRNAAPTAFAVPALGPPVLHQVTMCEADEFVPRSEVGPQLPAAEILELRDVDGRLKVRLVPDPRGMPLRHRRPPAVYVQPGEWVRWQINYRFGPACSCGDEWSYRLDTVSVSFGATARDTFLGTPTWFVDERGQLR